MQNHPSLRPRTSSSSSPVHCGLRQQSCRFLGSLAFHSSPGKANLSPNVYYPVYDDEINFSSCVRLCDQKLWPSPSGDHSSYDVFGGAGTKGTNPNLFIGMSPHLAPFSWSRPILVSPTHIILFLVITISLSILNFPRAHARNDQATTLAFWICALLVAPIVLLSERKD